MGERVVRAILGDAPGELDAAQRGRAGRRASLFSIGCNVALALAKGAVGIVAGSISITADAANNLSDAATNVVSLVGFTLASRPADAEHPWGHGRSEYLATLAVAGIICWIGITLVRDAIARIADPAATDASLAAVVVLVLSIAVKLFMGSTQGRLAAHLASPTLAACAIDSRNDCVATAAVLACTLIEAACHVHLDGVVGAVVGVFVFWGGVGVVRDTVDTLLGHAPDPALVERIRERVLAESGVVGMHDLMVHDYGPGHLFASAHVEVVPGGDVSACHAMLDAIERDLFRTEHINITLHPDPFERVEDES